jgi:hypothetical protein
MTRLAEGMALTHELTEAEAAWGMLSADDDLGPWARLTLGDRLLPDGGIAGTLPLEKDGEVIGVLQASSYYDLPPGYCDDDPIGQGMVAQFLVGPDGWLAGYQPGDMLALRFSRGAIHLSRHDGDLVAGKGTEIFRNAAAEAARDTLEQFGDGSADLYVTPIDELLQRLLEEEPGIFQEPEPPLRAALGEAGLEAFGGNFGVRGTPWNVTSTRNLARGETTRAITALGILLSDSPDPKEILGNLVFSPGVVGFVSAEIEYRTLHGFSFAAAVAGLREAARTPLEHVAALFCAARAAEGAGDSASASDLVREVLFLQPLFKEALLDAAEYALCRGDVQAADRYLSKAGDHYAATDTRRTLAPLLAAPKAKVGRNEPCPCGSGKKHKQCCLGRQSSHPLPARAKVLYQLLVVHAQRPAYGETFGRLITRADVSGSTAMYCVDLMISAGGAAERFLRTRGDWLAAGERELIESWQRVPVSLHEITEVRRGSGLMVRVLPDGEPFLVEDRLLSQSPLQGVKLVLGRALPDGETFRFLSIPVFLKPAKRDSVLKALAKEHPPVHELALLAKASHPGIRIGE